MNLQSLLRETHNLQFQGGTTLWVVHRRLVERKAQYKVLRVNIEESLKRKLRALTEKATKWPEKLSHYEFEGAQRPNEAYVLTAAEGGFQAIRAQIDQGSKTEVAQSADDLLNSWAYITRQNTAGGPLYAFRKVSNIWTAKKAGGLLTMNTFFRGGMLIDLDHTPVFRIDDHVDFLCYADQLIILDKDEFEHAMNFREGLKERRDELVVRLKELDVFTEPDLFTTVVEDKLPLLRKMANVARMKYYESPQYLEAMVEKAAERGWGIEVSGGRIVVTEENVPVLLRLMNNDRLRSPINDQLFDVTGIKEPVQESPRLEIAKPKRKAPKGMPSTTAVAAASPRTKPALVARR